MARRDDDEYGQYVPLLIEHAALARDEPRRERTREQLVAAFLPVAQHVARRFAGRGDLLEDL